MPLGIRIFLVYVFFIALTGYFVLNTVMEEIRPGMRQSTEETLVDTANLMAEILRDDFKAGTLNQNRWPELLKGLRRAATGGDHLGPAEEPGQSPHLRHRRQRHRPPGFQRHGGRPGLFALERRVPDPARRVRRTLDPQPA